MPLIPKDVKFFDMMTEQVKVIKESIYKLKEITQKEDFSEENIKKIKELEQHCDTISHEIIDVLNETFITPIDREDIHKIINEIDDIMDLINVVANRLYIYKIKSVKNTYLPEFIENISDAVDAVNNAIVSLKDIKKTRRILEYCIEINRLENSGDSLRMQWKKA